MFIGNAAGLHSKTGWQEEAQRKYDVCLKQTVTRGDYLHTDMTDFAIASFLFA